MDHRLNILKMLEAGTITAAEAEALLEALDVEREASDTETLRNECAALREECVILKERCEQLLGDCQGLRDQCMDLERQCEDWSTEAEESACAAEEYANQVEDYADEAEERAGTHWDPRGVDGSVDPDALTEELRKIQVLLESLGIQCVDLERVCRPTGGESKRDGSQAPRNSYTRRGDPTPHGFTLATAAEREAWFEKRAADRKRREGDRKRREQDRVRRDGDRVRRNEERRSDSSFTKAVRTLGEGSILRDIRGTVVDLVEGDIIVPSFIGNLQGHVTGATHSSLVA